MGALLKNPSGRAEGLLSATRAPRRMLRMLLSPTSGAASLSSWRWSDSSSSVNLRLYESLQMTLSQFPEQRNVRACQHCGNSGATTELNANNNGLLVRCSHCGSNRPWGSLLYLKQNEHRRPRRPSLPNGQSLDSIWEKFDNRCFVCSAPKAVLAKLGIGRQVHHVAPYSQEGHRGPLVPICTHCHPVVTDRQRIFWFIQRLVLGDEHDDRAGTHVDAAASAEVTHEGQLFD